jgi:hypothetical protein
MRMRSSIDRIGTIAIRRVRAILVLTSLARAADAQAQSLEPPPGTAAADINGRPAPVPSRVVLHARRYPAPEEPLVPNARAAQVIIAPYAPKPFDRLRRDIEFETTRTSATLQVRSKDGWLDVCEGPCTVPGHVGSVYRVGGHGVSNSRTFNLPAGSDSFVLVAHPGSSTQRALGFVVIPIGALAMTVGFSMKEAGDLFHDESAAHTGVGILLAGAVALAGGIAVVVSNATQLDFQSGSRAAIPKITLARGLELSAEGIRF